MGRPKTLHSVRRQLWRLVAQGVPTVAHGSAGRSYGHLEAISDTADASQPRRCHVGVLDHFEKGSERAVRDVLVEACRSEVDAVLSRTVGELIAKAVLEAVVRR